MVGLPPSFDFPLWVAHSRIKLAQDFDTVAFKYGIQIQLILMLFKSKKEVHVICDNIRSLYNVGSIFRTSDALNELT